MNREQTVYNAVKNYREPYVHDGVIISDDIEKFWIIGVEYNEMVRQLSEDWTPTLPDWSIAGDSEVWAKYHPKRRVEGGQCGCWLFTEASGLYDAKMIYDGWIKRPEPVEPVESVEPVEAKWTPTKGQLVENWLDGCQYTIVVPTPDKEDNVFAIDSDGIHAVISLHEVKPVQPIDEQHNSALLNVIKYYPNINDPMKAHGALKSM